MNKYFQQNKTLFSCGILSTLAYIYLAMQSQHYGDASLTQLLIVATACFVLSIIAWWHYYKSEETVHIGTLLCFAVVFRVIGFCTFPILEDDIYRYLWDGRMTIENGSPYNISPAEFFSATDLGERFDTILSSINYPNIATIYGPVCQWVFAFCYLLAPGEIWPLQAFFGLADILLIFVLLKLAKPIYVLLYAWSPLIIKELTITAHPDGLGALLLILAVWSYQNRNWYLTGALLALALGVKVFAVMLLPFLLGYSLRGWSTFIITAIIIALPFGLTDAWFPAGLQEMNQSWLFNAPIYITFIQWFSVDAIKAVMLSALAIGCAIYYWQVIRLWPATRIRGDLLLAALFLCAPAFNAWYLAWLLPFAVIYPSVWAWAASLSLLLAYASGINLNGSGLGPYQQPYWLIVIEFAFILFAILFAAIFKRVYTKKIAG